MADAQAEIDDILENTPYKSVEDQIMMQYAANSSFKGYDEYQALRRKTYVMLTAKYMIMSGDSESIFNDVTEGLKTTDTFKDMKVKEKTRRTRLNAKRRKKAKEAKEINQLTEQNGGDGNLELANEEIEKDLSTDEEVIEDVVFGKIMNNEQDIQSVSDVSDGEDVDEKNDNNPGDELAKPIENEINLQDKPNPELEEQHGTLPAEQKKQPQTTGLSTTDHVKDRSEKFEIEKPGYKNVKLPMTGTFALSQGPKPNQIEETLGKKSDNLTKTKEPKLDLVPGPQLSIQSYVAPVRIMNKKKYTNSNSINNVILNKENIIDNDNKLQDLMNVQINSRTTNFEQSRIASLTTGANSESQNENSSYFGKLKNVFGFFF